MSGLTHLTTKSITKGTLGAIYKKNLLLPETRLKKEISNEEKNEDPMEREEELSDEDLVVITKKNQELARFSEKRTQIGYGTGLNGIVKWIKYHKTLSMQILVLIVIILYATTIGVVVGLTHVTTKEYTRQQRQERLK